MYWKAGKDSHEDIIELYVKKDKLLIDNELPPNFVRVEIVPENNDYLNPNGKWIFKLDVKKAAWWNKEYEKLCWNALPLWKKKVYTFNLEEAKNPIHPFKIESPEITEEILELLKIWASVWASVWDSVWDSVGASVGASVRASIRASVWAYIGLMFPKIKKWKYIDYTKEPFNKIKSYPFQACVDLWKMGLVPSYDSYNEVWRLHGLKGGEVKILWEGKLDK
ncbi:MAG: hypothetical protein ACYCXQ_00900 [Candidatus Humimicrobiaceae bacterium]